MDNNIPFSPSRLDSTFFFNNNFKDFLKNKRDIIDIGCGKLYLVKLIKELNISVRYLGIDIKPKKLKGKNIKIIKANFLEYKTKKKFDTAACLWVLEHINEDAKTVKKMSELLKKNGILFLAVPSIFSWPFEFGRHGYHYYTKKRILQIAKSSHLEIVTYYDAGGFFGFIFMILYNWLRFFILIISLPIFIILSQLRIYQKTWKEFSVVLIKNTIYSYHRSHHLLKIHNTVVRAIIAVDKLFKFFPASYIFILRKR